MTNQPPGQPQWSLCVTSTSLLSYWPLQSQSTCNARSPGRCLIWTPWKSSACGTVGLSPVTSPCRKTSGDGCLRENSRGQCSSSWAAWLSSCELQHRLLDAWRNPSPGKVTFSEHTWASHPPVMWLGWKACLETPMYKGTGWTSCQDDRILETKLEAPAAEGVK